DVWRHSKCQNIHRVQQCVDVRVRLGLELRGGLPSLLWVTAPDADQVRARVPRHAWPVDYPRPIARSDQANTRLLHKQSLIAPDAEFSTVGLRKWRARVRRSGAAAASPDRVRTSADLGNASLRARET